MDTPRGITTSNDARLANPLLKTSKHQVQIDALLRAGSNPTDIESILSQLSNKSVIYYFEDIATLLGEIATSDLMVFISSVYTSETVSNERKAMVANVLYFYHKELFPIKGGMRMGMRALTEYYNKVAHFKNSSDNTDPGVVSLRSGRIVENEFVLDGAYNQKELRATLSKPPFSLEGTHINAIIAKLREDNRTDESSI